MAKTGRPRHIDPPVEVHISLPQSLAVTLDLLLHSPVTGKPKVGARSQLLTALLEDFIQAYSTKQATISTERTFSILYSIIHNHYRA